MANKKFFAGMLIGLLAFGLGMAGCENPSGGGGEFAALAGTWTKGIITITISGNSMTIAETGYATRNFTLVSYKESLLETKSGDHEYYFAVTVESTNGSRTMIMSNGTPSLTPYNGQYVRNP